MQSIFTHPVQSDDSIRKWLRMFDNTGKSTKYGREGSASDEDTVQEIRASVSQNPLLSLQKRRQALIVQKLFLHQNTKKTCLPNPAW